MTSNYPLERTADTSSGSMRPTSSANTVSTEIGTNDFRDSPQVGGQTESGLERRRSLLCIRERCMTSRRSGGKLLASQKTLDDLVVHYSVTAEDIRLRADSLRVPGAELVRGLRGPAA